MLRTPIVITEHQTYVPSEDFDIYSFLTITDKIIALSDMMDCF